jgi:hypothetical protein
MSLVDKNVLRAERHSMLETIREYAFEQLAESGETEEVHRRHAQCFLARAERLSCVIVGTLQSKGPSSAASVAASAQSWLSRCFGSRRRSSGLSRPPKRHSSSSATSRLPGRPRTDTRAAIRDRRSGRPRSRRAGADAYGGSEAPTRSEGMKDPPGQGESVEGGSATRSKLSRSADSPSLKRGTAGELDRAAGPGKKRHSGDSAHI